MAVNESCGHFGPYRIYRPFKEKGMARKYIGPSKKKAWLAMAC
jgi:hypothetical protein